MVPATTPASSTWTARRLILATLVACAVVLAFWLLYRYYVVPFIVFIGIVLGTVIRPPVQRLGRRGLPRALGVVLAYILLLALLAGCVRVAAPLLTEQVTTIAGKTPEYYQSLRTSLTSSPSRPIQRLAAELPATLPFSLEAPTAPAATPPAAPAAGASGSAPAAGDTALSGFAQLLGYLGLLGQAIFIATSILVLAFYWTLDGERSLRSLLLRVPTGPRENVRDLIAQMETKVAIVLVLSIYWGADRVHFERLWLSVLPAEQRVRARAIWRSIEKGVGAYIRSEVVQSLLAGVLLGLGFWAMGLDYPALLALIGALLWLVPLVGGALAIVPVLLVGFAASPLPAAGASVYAVAVFLMEEWLVEPRIFYRWRFSSILIIITMIALSYALGVAGLLLAPPLAAAIQIFFGQLTAEPLAATSLEAMPQISSLRERLAKVRDLVNEMEGGPAPESASLVERLERLVDDAGQALSEDVPNQPPSGFARLRAVPVEK